MTNLQIVQWFQPTGFEVVNRKMHEMLDVKAPKRVTLGMVQIYAGNEDSAHCYNNQ